MPFVGRETVDVDAVRGLAGRSEDRRRADGGTEAVVSPYIPKEPLSAGDIRGDGGDGAP